MKPVRVLLVTGLSGAGKASVLRQLEDLGFETVDNPPLELLETLVRDECQPGHRPVGDRPPAEGLAIGFDARSRGFDQMLLSDAVARLRALDGVELELIYMMADDASLLSRYTETRRRHPLAPRGRVSEGIALERLATDLLRHNADLVIDTSDLTLPGLRQLVERKFGREAEVALAVTIMSFAFPKGLPRDSDMVFDARFLRNPHYDPILRPRTGLDPEVAAFVAADPDFTAFMQRIIGLLEFLLPRFVREGKRYATIAVGCTGGRHRSVHVVEMLGCALSRLNVGAGGLAVNISHRELPNTSGHNPPMMFSRQVGISDPPSSIAGDQVVGGVKQV